RGRRGVGARTFLRANRPCGAPVMGRPFLAGSAPLPETRPSPARGRPARRRRTTTRRGAAPMLYSTLAIATRVHTFRRSRMKAIRIHASGGPEVMKLEDVPEPQPKAGEAIVRIDAAGLNYIDVYQRSGLYDLDLPLTLGLEAGGTVTAVGAGVTEVKVGDKVAYTGVPGAYAQYAAVPAQRLVVLPPGLQPKQ